MKKVVLFFVLTVALTGCGPKSPSRALMQGYHPTPVEKGYAELILCRPWKFVSGGVYSAFLINGQPAVNFKSGCARFYVKPGKHLIATKVTDYDSSDWGKPLQVEAMQGKTTVVTFHAGNRKLSESPGFAYQNMTFFAPENQTIHTVYQGSEDEQSETAETVQVSTYKEEINSFVEAEDYSGLKAYVNENPGAAYYIPDYKMRLLFIGPKGFQVGDIINYKKKNMSDMVLVAKIKGSKVPYKQFSMEEIVMLQEYNISDTLIVAMLDVTTEIEKEMARDEKQRKFLEDQRSFMKKNQAGPASGNNKTVAQELTQEVGKQLIKNLLKNAF